MSAHKPTVSVIMAAHNAGPYIKPTIYSLLNQTFSDFELIIVDDASTDNTADLVKAIADPRIVLIRNPENYKLARSLNIAIDAAKGRYIARHDVEDLSLPERLRLQVDYLDSHPEIDLVGSYLYVINDNWDIIGSLTVPLQHQEIIRRVRDISLIHPTIMAKAEWFRRFKYDERYARAQDRELFLRAYRTSRYANLPYFLYAWRNLDRINFNKLVRSLYYNVDMIVKNWRTYQMPPNEVWYFLTFVVGGRLIYYFLSAILGKNLVWAHNKSPEISETFSRDASLIRTYLAESLGL